MKAQPGWSAGESPVVDLGREVCTDISTSEKREWLITNGIGGFGSGTVSGILTRRYHGLLIAALDPPVDRTALVRKVEEIVEYDGSTYYLGSNRWSGGAIDPQGYVHIDRFSLQGSIPVWTFSLADALLEKRIWMEDRRNTTYVRYDLVRGDSARLTLKCLVSYRDYHAVTHAGDWRMNISAGDSGLCVTAFDGARPFYMRSAAASAEPSHDWYRNFNLSIERERGLEDREDLLHAGTFEATVEPGKPLTLVFSLEPDADLDGAASLERAVSRDVNALRVWRRQRKSAPAATGWPSQLVLASQQFIVDRTLADGTVSQSIIAGYPWFTDWGRDAMIALPGLTLSTGRMEIARNILRTFSRFLDSGILPNFFPKAGIPPEYNSVDAALWYVEAMRQYHAASGDKSLVRDCFPALSEIMERYHDGTRFNIHADPSDGLISAGEPGVQLTWMDAKVGDWVVTPRVGKPIEVNALWLNALVTMAEFAKLAGEPGGRYTEWLNTASKGFQRFWNEDLKYCSDVLDGPDGDDHTLRPNQIFAVSLPHSALNRDQQKAVVDVCSRRLCTPYGLRTLALDHPHCCRRCTGPPVERDAAYHQGTVWGWLLGPFALAHYRVYGNAQRALQFLEPLARQIWDFGLGSIGEIFDAEAPFAPRGCPAQAWSVGELLHAWDELTLQNS